MQAPSTNNTFALNLRSNSLTMALKVYFYNLTSAFSVGLSTNLAFSPQLSPIPFALGLILPFPLSWPSSV